MFTFVGTTPTLATSPNPNSSSPYFFRRELVVLAELPDLNERFSRQELPKKHRVQQVEPSRLTILFLAVRKTLKSMTTRTELHGFTFLLYPSDKQIFS